MDTAGAPVSQARFRAYVDVHPMNLAFNRTDSLFESDEEGAFEFQASTLQSETWWLFLRSSWQAPMERAAWIPLPAQTDDVRELDVGTVVVSALPVLATGTFRDEAGDPVSEHFVRLSLQIRVPVVRQFVRHLETRAEPTWCHPHGLRIERGSEGTFRVLGWSCTDRARVCASVGPGTAGDWVEFEPGAEQLDLRVPVTGGVGGSFLQTTEERRLSPHTIWVEFDTSNNEPIGGWLDRKGKAGWRRMRPGKVRARLFANLDSEPFAEFEGTLEPNGTLAFDAIPRPESLNDFRVRVVDSEGQLVAARFRPEGTANEDLHPRFSVNRNGRDGTYTLASTSKRPRIRVFDFGAPSDETRLVELCEAETTVVLERQP